MKRLTRLLPFALGGALLGAVGGVSLGLGRWDLTWYVWFAYFAVVEGKALANSRANDTLSEHVWQWFGIDLPGTAPREVTGWVRLRRFVLLAFMAWLAAHFLSGGRF